jgi:hypothetical protein
MGKNHLQIANNGEGSTVIREANQTRLTLNIRLDA